MHKSPHGYAFAAAYAHCAAAMRQPVYVLCTAMQDCVTYTAHVSAWDRPHRHGCCAQALWMCCAVVLSVHCFSSFRATDCPTRIITCIGHYARSSGYQRGQEHPRAPTQQTCKTPTLCGAFLRAIDASWQHGRDAHTRVRKPTWTTIMTDCHGHIHNQERMKQRVYEEVLDTGMGACGNLQAALVHNQMAVD